METKVCSKCGEEKELSEFHKAKANKDGHCGICKVCTKEYQYIRNNLPIEYIIINEKICTKCGNKKSISNFEKRKGSKDGYRNECKDCLNDTRKIRGVKDKEKIVEKRKKYYEENKSMFLDKRALYIKNNIDKVKESRSRYYQKNKDKMDEWKRQYNIENKEKIKTQRKEFYELNKEEIIKNQQVYYHLNKDSRAEYNKKYQSENKDILRKKNSDRVAVRLKTDILYKLKHNLKTEIRRSLTDKGYTKSQKTIEILGCTFEELKIYLESKFEPWMNWNNRGNWNGIPTEPNTAWDIDHIIPLYTATCEEDIIKLNHHTNLQPLCSYVNRYVKRHHILD